jgi:hypothetical protein
MIRITKPLGKQRDGAISLRKWDLVGGLGSTRGGKRP